MILRSGLRAFRRPIRRGVELREWQHIEQSAAREEDAGMRAVELVRRAGQKIAAEGLHIDQLVRREVNRIDEEQPTGIARDRGNAS